MKGPLDRTKVVLRRLPPAISQSALMEQIDGRFAGRYIWVSFRPGKNSQKHQLYSRAYIDFKRPEDVIEFAEFFDGHVFVNEKGTQFKTIVEYAPSQRVPKLWSKKDGREGTILKDPGYLEFLEFLAKPVENLPSAEIQLERKEAERAGAAKDAPIVTPLMDFVRQKRAVKGGSRRSLSNGKLTRRTGGASSGSPSSASSKRGSEKRRISTTMYVLRDTAKSTSGKNKSTNILVPKRDDQPFSESVTFAAASGTEVLEEEHGVSGTADIGKKKILLLKGKEKEIPYVSGGMTLQQTAASPVKKSPGSTLKQNQRREASGRIIRSILLNKDARQSQSSSVVQSEQQIQTSNLEKDKRPPRPLNVQLFFKDTNGAQEDKVGNDLLGFSSEKQEKRTRNKDRPDRGVWTPLRRSDGSHASDESLQSSTSQAAQLLPDFSEGSHGELKIDMLDARSGELKTLGGGRSGHSSLDNGSHKHGGRRGPAHNVKDADGSSIISEGKPFKRGETSVGSKVKFRFLVLFNCEILGLLPYWSIHLLVAGGSLLVDEQSSGTKVPGAKKRFLSILTSKMARIGAEKNVSMSLSPSFKFKSNSSHCRKRIPFLARSSNGSAPSSSSSNGYPSTTTLNKTFPGNPEADVVVIGSGIGGLCCAGLLARYNQDVLVLESHDLPGGAAHSFEIKGYKFDSGPSLFSGFQSRGPQANPLAQVLDALGESIPCAKYDSWMVYLPEADFLSRIGPTEFFKDLEKYASPDAVREWKKLLDAILPMSAAAMALPPLSIRGDWGVLSTAAARYAPSLLKSFAQMGPQGALSATKLLRPFSEIIDSLELKDPFIRNWIDLLAFLLAGVKSDGILSAEMVYMFAEWYKPGCSLEYPLHGTGAVVDALVRGIQNFGGRISLRSHVENIVVENGRAIGVKLRSGQFVRAKKAVVSNASMWDTLNLLPREAIPKSYQDGIKMTPQCESFMHLHLGFDKEGIREDLGIHHIVVNNWERGVDADQNVVLISVPSVLSPDLAPPGKHVLHAYTPGTEPFGIWEGLDRRSTEYKKLKAERSEVMWRAVGRALGPGFNREKCEVKLVGTPLTHQSFSKLLEYDSTDTEWMPSAFVKHVKEHFISEINMNLTIEINP
ncbi:hypothetical protein F0562_020241 [Nyssa sinensis]|uniref:Uncharacterized protein n=1 Tax=Nyssa sinensis TaxID=561372 RepID=A0A5J5BUK6_9ASTE|nr:hypothetical protein F0562_020241 [Nyssa sinensis]